MANDNPSTLAPTLLQISITALFPLALPHSALSSDFSLAENLASLSLQDGATEWLYYPNSYPPTHPPAAKLFFYGTACRILFKF